MTICLDMSIDKSLELYSSPMATLLETLDCIGDDVMKCSPVTVLDNDGCHVTKQLQGTKQYYSIRLEVWIGVLLMQTDYYQV